MAYDNKLDIYLNQIINNPYIDELRSNIYKSRKDLLKKIWGDEYELSSENINTIFNYINDENDLQIIKDNFYKIDIKNLFGTLFKPLFIVPLKKLKIIINNRTIVDKPFAPYSKSPKISLSRNLPQG